MTYARFLHEMWHNERVPAPEPVARGPVMVNVVFDPPEVLLAFLNIIISTYL